MFYLYLILSCITTSTAYVDLADMSLTTSSSGEFSNFIAGAPNAPWERQTQLVLGLNAQVEQTSRIFLEVFKMEGYAPLNFICGGNFDNPGETHSDRDARSLGAVIGVLFSI